MYASTCACLARQERVDRSVELSVAQPMAGPGRLRHEAARDLVLALCAGLEPLEPFADAVVDALVVAGLEVQAVEVSAAAPVAAVQRRAAAKADRRGDRRRPGGARARRAGCSGIVAATAREEVAVQVRLAAAPPKRSRIELEDRVPVGRCRLVAAQVLEHDAGFGDSPPLAFGFLALVGAEPRQGTRRSFGSRRWPSEIDSSCASGSPACSSSCRSGSVGNSTCSDDAPSSSAVPRAASSSRAAMPGSGALAQQQAPAGRRREGYGGDELRVVIATRSLVGVGPAPVEYELAVRVVFNKEWQRAGEALLVARDEVAGLPGRPVPDAAALLERDAGTRASGTDCRRPACSRPPRRSRASVVSRSTCTCMRTECARRCLERRAGRLFLARGLCDGRLISIISALSRLTTAQLE